MIGVKLDGSLECELIHIGLRVDEDSRNGRVDSIPLRTYQIVFQTPHSLFDGVFLDLIQRVNDSNIAHHDIKFEKSNPVRDSIALSMISPDC